MRRRKFTAFFMGITVVASTLFVASPASAAAGRLFNAGPQMTGYCLATHEPYVFAYSKCSTERYIDQRWDVVNWNNGYRIQSLYLQGCLTAHPNGHVFLSPCNLDYSDQYWFMND